ncbi:hypothetical protein AKJ46_00965 [candidate division MSBL1 archaeon SCGC-AAA833K04]|uniref:DDE domain-containing protein n=1 Tax=candidate division MSBL1 archaeon SCGC-AAA833K04 TaxID=1698258 RepID=A0A133VRJ1_9EURY|nr:hypothetical protein AKJ46_00965 [candidate division MSBL1 archaeon SCGC-AAA833K04]
MCMNPKCPVCESDSWKIGFSKCDRRRYKCKSCGKKFNERAGTPFHWLYKPEEEVITATVMYVKYPLSSYQASEILGFFGMDISPSAIRDWPQRFGSHLKKIAKNYEIKFSKVWHVDEKFTPHKRESSPKKKRGKRKWAYQITVLDSKGDVVASYLSPERSTKAIEKALRRAKDEAGFSPDIIARDDFPAYDKAVKVLGRRTKDVHTHFEEKLILHDDGVIPVSNNRIERYHSEIAPKIRSMRGVKSLKSGDQFFQIYKRFRNLFKKDRLKEILERFKLKLTWSGLVKMFYLTRDL